MLQRLINRSPDIKKLVDEGYSIRLNGGILIIEDVPYLNASLEVKYGKLISPLNLQGEKAVYHNDHVVYFSGEMPHHGGGAAINEILHSSNRTDHGNDIISEMSFSNKPANGYRDYHHKMTYYIHMISTPAKGFDPEATAQKYKAIEESGDSVFNYIDTNSSRASITHLSERLQGYKIGIIGLGGTGSYILDYVAKTPVSEIHLFDGDKFHTHNAFRAPGAPSVEVLNEGLNKVEYLQRVYSKMHRQIIAHSYFIDSRVPEALNGLNFVFVAVDNGDAKREIFTILETANIPFIDVGMGIINTENSKLKALVRASSIVSDSRKHLIERIDFSSGEDDAYTTNIQIAELNAINASIAVILWKQHAGFYEDLFGVGEVQISTDTLNLWRVEDAS